MNKYNEKNWNSNSSRNKCNILLHYEKCFILFLSLKFWIKLLSMAEISFSFGNKQSTKKFETGEKDRWSKCRHRKWLKLTCSLIQNQFFGSFVDAKKILVQPSNYEATLIRYNPFPGLKTGHVRIFNWEFRDHRLGLPMQLFKDHDHFLEELKIRELRFTPEEDRLRWWNDIRGFPSCILCIGNYLLGESLLKTPPRETNSKRYGSS